MRFLLLRGIGLRFAPRITTTLHRAFAATTSGTGTIMDSQKAASDSQQQPQTQQQAQPQPADAAGAQQATQQPHPPPAAEPHRTLEDLDTLELNTKRNQILWEQAVKGQQPGLTLMQDRLSGENKQETWGNEPTIHEPDNQD